jgi:Avidin family
MGIHEKISGVWYSELGSVMNLTAEEGGALSGTYKSKVGATDEYLLAGRFYAYPPENKFGYTVGWAVTFYDGTSGVNSTTAWSGQYFDDGVERILTHWLLSRGNILDSLWESTLVGHVTFTRDNPNPS